MGHRGGELVHSACGGIIDFRPGMLPVLGNFVVAPSRGVRRLLQRALHAIDTILWFVFRLFIVEGRACDDSVLRKREAGEATCQRSHGSETVRSNVEGSFRIVR